MIISHTAKIIFVKTKKTAGTSFEIALSKFCGPDCVITPISPNDEDTRNELGFRTCQNYEVQRWRNICADTQERFVNHTRAGDIRSRIPAEVWNTYTKISIVRNPYDVAISRYFWELAKAEEKLDFGTYIHKFPRHLTENAKIAPLTGHDQLDHYLRYENLHEDLTAIGLEHISDVFANIRAKADKRPKSGTSIPEMYARFPKAARAVEKACAAEIAHVGYAIIR